MPVERESPTAEWMQRMRIAFQGAVSEDDMREIAQELVKRAKGGDRRALEMLLTYAMPVPKEPTRHERLSAHLNATVPARRGLPNGKSPPVELEG